MLSSGQIDVVTEEGIVLWGHQAIVPQRQRYQFNILGAYLNKNYSKLLLD